MESSIMGDEKEQKNLVEKVKSSEIIIDVN